MKAVLMSIKPQWCELIAKGKKLIEIRKSKPKLETPFTCYIYCTKPQGKVIGEFTCEGIFEFEAEISRRANAYEAITLRRESEDFSEYGDYRYSLVAENGNNNNWLMYQSCVMWDDLKKYLGYKSRDFYGWGITCIDIYKEPKELSEFGLTRPPQSWCYI